MIYIMDQVLNIFQYKIYQSNSFGQVYYFFVVALGLTLCK